MKKINPVVRGSSPKTVQKSSGDTAKKKPLDEKLFKAAVAAKLREIGAIGENEDYLNHPALEEAIVLFEVGLGKLLPQYDNAVQASAAFNDWIDETGYRYEPAPLYRIEQYTITATAVTKSGTISIASTITPLVSEHADAIRAAKNELQEIFNAVFVGVSSANKSLSAPQSGKVEYTIEEVEVNTLRVSVYNDKIVYHAMPVEGNWTQYGIPLYADVARKFGIELPDEEGEYEISWHAAYELRPDGKPRRVVEIH